MAPILLGGSSFLPSIVSLFLYQGQADDPPTSESEAAALLSSMTAYTGKFRLDGDKFITQVDGAWNEFYKGSEQVRYFELTGDKLSIRTPEQQSGILIGKRTVATLMWEREVP